MHVLITSDTVGGVWTYTQELVSGLIGRGHSVTLVSFGKLPLPHQTSWMQHLPRLDYRPTEYRLEWMEVAPKDIDESKRYLELLISEVQPDVLHLSQYCYGDIPVSIPKIVVAHSDVGTWWAAVHGRKPDNTPWMRQYRDTVTAGLEGADLVVAPSQWMLDALSAHYFRPKHGLVVNNGRTPELFHRSLEKDDFALSVGRIWDPGKQVQLLLSANMKTQVRIVGWEDQPGRENKEQIEARSVNVEMLGPRSQSELRDLYASAAIYVATSRYEPFGLSPLEAALSGCALVMNDIPVFHELWGDAAFFFRQNDPDDLAQVVNDLSENARLRKEMGSRAYRTAREKFNASRMVDDYEKVYEGVSSTARVA